MHGDDKTCFLDMKNEAAKGRDADRIIINVGGYKHETHLSTLRNFPDTRLSWMVESALTNGFQSSEDGSPVEYFFDRHPGVFVHILNYYRTGKLHCPTDVCGPLFEDELNFWGIDELQMEPCCWSTYTRHRDAQAFEKVFSANTKQQEDDASDDGEAVAVGSIWRRQFLYSSYKQKIWELLEKPYSSKGAQILALFSLLVIIISVVTFCLETIPELRDYKELFQRLDNTYCAVFTLDFIARVLCCPDIAVFFRSTLTWCDITSVIPFYTNMIWSLNYINVVLVVRLFRIFRLFRFFRFMSGMQVIGHTLRASARELLLLVLILLIPMVIFSSLLFYTEKAFDGDTRFYSIPHSFWWAVITMTTVGYGDIYPQTALGRLIGTICACSGVLIVALPVSVIGSNFSLFYSHAQAQLKLPRKRKQPALVGAASALMSAVDQELTSSSGTDSDPESNSGSESKLNGTSKYLLTQETDKSNHVGERESIELRCKSLAEKRSFLHSSHSLDSRQKDRSRGKSGMGVEKGLKAMGDIMLNIAAPAQRRMAISGVSLSHSPSLRRSNSGKRKARPKSVESLRKQRANTSASENCTKHGSHPSCLDESIYGTPERSAEDTTDKATDDFPPLSRYRFLKSDSYPVVKCANNGERNKCAFSSRPQGCHVDRSSTPSDEHLESKHLDFNAASPCSDTQAREKIKKRVSISHEALHLPRKDTAEPQNQRQDIGMASGQTHIDSSDTAAVAIDHSKLSPWYKTNTGQNEPVLTRIGRRRSATLNVCNV